MFNVISTAAVPVEAFDDQGEASDDFDDVRSKLVMLLQTRVTSLMGLLGDKSMVHQYKKKQKDMNVQREQGLSSNQQPCIPEVAFWEMYNRDIYVNRDQYVAIAVLAELILRKRLIDRREGTDLGQKCSLFR